jgi:hypothetical protein
MVRLTPDGPEGVETLSAAPHSTQNFAPAIRGVPHSGQNRIDRFLSDVLLWAQYDDARVYARGRDVV